MLTFSTVVTTAVLFLAKPPTVTPPVEVQGKQKLTRDPTSTVTTLRPSDLPGGGEGKTVGDLLALTPGMQVRRDGSDGSRQTAMLRGTDNQQVLVLLDFVRINPAMGGGTDLSSIPLAMVDRIEIYRGGGGALFGTDAVGGVIRIVPRIPPGGLHFSGGSRWGSFGAMSESAAIGYGVPSGLYSALATYEHQTATGDFPFIDSNNQHRIRTHAASERHSSVVTGGVRFGKKTRLSSISEMNYTHRDLPGIEQFPSSTATSDEFRFISALTLALNALGTPALDFKVRIGGRLQHSAFSDTKPYFPPPIDTVTTGGGVDAGLDATWYAPAGHRLTFQTNFIADFATIDRVGAPAENNRTPTRYIGTALIQDEWSIWDEQLTVQAVVRLDISDIHGAEGVPRLGIRYAPQIPRPWQLSLRVGGGRAYRLPSFNELYFDTGLVRGDPNLAPEDSWSVDGGIELGYGPLHLSLTGFHLAIDNLILFLPTTAFTIEASNSHGARSSGVEVGLKFKPWKWLALSGRYSFIDARFLDTNRRLPGRAQHVYGGRLSLNINSLTVWASLNGSGSFFLDRFEGIQEEGRFFVNVGWQVQVGPHLNVNMEARNVADNRRSIDALQQPLPGFALYGSLKWTR
jgi:vitamin B12 transporter